LLLYKCRAPEVQSPLWGDPYRAVVGSIPFMPPGSAVGALVTEQPLTFGPPLIACSFPYTRFLVHYPNWLCECDRARQHRIMRWYIHSYHPDPWLAGSPFMSRFSFSFVGVLILSFGPFWSVDSCLTLWEAWFCCIHAIVDLFPLFYMESWNCWYMRQIVKMWESSSILLQNSIAVKHE